MKEVLKSKRKKRRLVLKLGLVRITIGIRNNTKKSSSLKSIPTGIVGMKKDETTIKSINFSIKLLLTIKINCF